MGAEGVSLLAAALTCPFSCSWKSTLPMCLFIDFIDALP